MHFTIVLTAVSGMDGSQTGVRDSAGTCFCSPCHMMVNVDRGVMQGKEKRHTLEMEPVEPAIVCNGSEQHRKIKCDP